MLVSDDSIVEIMVEAAVWVEIVEVEPTVTMEPPSDRFSAPTVILCAPSEDASAVIWFVEPSSRLKPLKVALLHDRSDLIAQRA